MFERKRVERVMYGIAAMIMVLAIAVAIVGIKAIIQHDENKQRLENLEKQKSEQTEVIEESDVVFLVGASQYVPTKEIEVTTEVFELLAERIAFEAKEADDMYGIGAVILNRVESDLFPDTVEEVLNQKGQFTPINVKMEYNEHMRLARSVASDLLYNKYRPFAKDVLMYRFTNYVRENNISMDQAVYSSANIVFFTMN